MRFSNQVFAALVLGAAVSAAGPAGARVCDMDDEALIDFMEEANRTLAGMELEIAIEQIDCFRIGLGRPSVRIHQQPFRWVPNDARRLAMGEDITYALDPARGATGSGLSAAQTDAAIDRAVTTWSATSCLSSVGVRELQNPPPDITIFDFLVGIGPAGDPFFADIVQAGWYSSPVLFDRSTLAFSVTFIFTESPGSTVPSDVNGDNYLDTAANEVYYNDDFSWGIDAPLPDFDVESVALHETGHSLGIGHFGPPPDAVMNPVYAGIRQELEAIDHAGMCTVWQSWPNP